MAARLRSSYRPKGDAVDIYCMAHQADQSYVKMEPWLLVNSGRDMADLEPLRLDGKIE